MSGPVRFDLDAEGLKRALATRPADITLGARKGLDLSMKRLDARMQKERLRGRPGLKRQTGRLAQSFTGEVSGKTIPDLRMRYGTNVKYARIHEFGGTIRPKRTKYLTIPLPAARTRAGVTRRRLTSGEDDSGVSLRNFQHVAFIRSKRGNLIALAGDTKDSMKPMFVLVKQVRIPARLGFRRLWIQERRRLIVTLNSEIRKALR